MTPASSVAIHVKSANDPNPNGNTCKTCKPYKTYKTNAGIPFECVEFVRRYFMQTRGLTFPSVVDATDMFYRVHALVPTQSTQATQAMQSVELQTRVYPYVGNALYYLRPGTMLFWVPEPTEELKYGHVALVIEADAEHVVVAQQNRSPPIQVHDTRALFNAINAPNSAYLGLKMVL